MSGYILRRTARRNPLQNSNVDFAFRRDHDLNVGLLQPVSDSAKKWIQKNWSRSGQRFFPTILLQLRDVQPVLEGLIVEGFNLSVIPNQDNPDISESRSQS